MKFYTFGSRKLIKYLIMRNVIIFQDKLDDVHKEALKYISLVGCCISIFFCILAALGFALAM